MSAARLARLVLVVASVSSCSLDFEGFFDGSTEIASGGASSASSGAGAAGGGGGAVTGSSSTAGGGGTAGAGGAGGQPIDPAIAGCSDGTREGFKSVADDPDIAACDGGFTVPGVRDPPTYDPQCNRAAGNDGALPKGDGCSVADLCADGWNVCESAAEVAANVPECPDPPPIGTFCCPDDVKATRYFYLTRQHFNNASCNTTTGINNILGCGKMVGEAADPADDCQPLDRKVRDRHCAADPDWECGVMVMDDESDLVTKHTSSAGGVLCCRAP